MKFYNVKDLEGFFKAVDECEGKVELVTGNGDKLNLKSNLCKYIAFASIIKDSCVPEMEIVTDNPYDAVTLAQFIMED